MKKYIPYSFFCLILLFVSGCGSSFGLKHTGAEAWIEEHGRTALNGDQLSINTREYLLRSGLFGEYRDNPKKTVTDLYEEALQNKDRELVSVLIELAYSQAKRESDPDVAVSYYLSACVYAYFYLFNETLEKKPSPFEPQFIFAVRFYNYSLAQIFKYLDRKKLLLSDNFTLPYLTGKVKFDASECRLPHPLKSFTGFKVCYDYSPVGFHSRTRQSGLGVPLVAVGNEKARKEKGKIFDISDVVCPVSLFLRLDIEKNGNAAGRLEYYDPMIVDKVKVGAHEAPLELAISTYLGYMLKSSDTILPIKAMIDPNAMAESKGLYILTSYRKDKIPVVFVHGLMSRPRTWVQMVNTLLKDSRIRRKYQFWFFAYPTANPVIYSAAKLRLALLQAQKEFDPEHDDPAFARMVLVAHSMGGLLSKIQIQNSDKEVMSDLFGVPSIEELGVSEEQEAFLKEMFLFHPLPFVSRVVFICVPHRGSEVTRWMISQFAARFIELPGDLVRKIADAQEKLLIKTHLKKNDDPVYISTGVDNLDPDNKGIKYISSLKIDEKVTYNSIMGNNEKAGIPGGTDGIVPYWSSHLDGAESELIVFSGHSAQLNPFAIKEVRRILLEHLKEK
jgi:hypothetical protein